jgi:hypothetical protein
MPVFIRFLREMTITVADFICQMLGKRFPLSVTMNSTLKTIIKRWVLSFCDSDVFPGLRRILSQSHLSPPHEPSWPDYCWSISLSGESQLKAINLAIGKQWLRVNGKISTWPRKNKQTPQANAFIVMLGHVFILLLHLEVLKACSCIEQTPNEAFERADFGILILKEWITWF